MDVNEEICSSLKNVPKITYVVSDLLKVKVTKARN